MNTCLSLVKKPFALLLLLLLLLLSLLLLLFSSNFDHVVSDIQLRIYLYFETTYGSVSSHVSPFEEKYQNKSNKELKSALRLLKSNRADLEEIKYVSKLIRSSLKNKQDSNFGLDQINLEKNFLHKFWSTCHDVFNKATNSLPTFSIVDCEHFFRRVLTTTNVSRFIVPGWIPRLCITFCRVRHSDSFTKPDYYYYYYNYTSETHSPSQVKIPQRQVQKYS